jgi:hypothetical protein
VDPLTIAAFASAAISGGSFIDSFFGGRRARRKARKERRRQREELANLQYQENRRSVAQATMLEASRAYEAQQGRGNTGRGSTIKSIGMKAGFKPPEPTGKNAIGVAY